MRVKSKFYGTMKNYFKLITLTIIAIFVFYPVGYNVLDGHFNSEITHKENFSSRKVGIYLINLDRSPERLKFIKKFTDDMSYDFHRISAVEGKLLSPSFIEENIDIKANLIATGSKPSFGEIGCYLSHLKTWKTFLESEYEFAFILEDDVGFNPSIIEKIIGELISNSQYWDLASFEMYHRGMPKKILQLSTSNYLAVHLAEIVHSGAYLLNRNGAEKLIKKALPMKMPLDLYFARSWEHDLIFAGIERPRLVHQLFGNSEIKATTDANYKQVSIIDVIKHKIFRFQTFIIRWNKNYELYREITKGKN